MGWNSFDLESDDFDIELRFTRSVETSENQVEHESSG